MIKSIFFRALTLLGLTFVLIGCGAADAKPGDGDTAPVNQADLEKMEGSIKDMIENAKGSINTSNGHAVAMKAISILKASQPNGSCSLFNQGIFAELTDASTSASYITKGDQYPGGSGSLAVTTSGTAIAAGVLAVATVIEYKYDKYSIDGIYFLDGTLKFKSATATDPTTMGVSDFTAEDGSILNLSIGTIDGAEAKKIAKIAFAAAFKPAFTAAAGLSCGVADSFGTVMVAPITITAEGEGKFTEPVVLAISAVGTATLLPAGTNAGLFMALLGPRRS